MKGFFKRDLTYMVSSMKIALVAMGIMYALSLVAALLDHEDAQPISFFLNVWNGAMILGGVIGLFQYDAQSGWMSYAAAVPNGRRDQIAARYLLVAVVCLVATVLAGGVSFLIGGVDSFLVSLLWIGGSLLILLPTIPLCYRFGSKGWMIGVLMLSCGGLVAGLGIGEGANAIVIVNVVANTGLWFGTMILALVLVAVAISYGISLRIMARKEL